MAAIASFSRLEKSFASFLEQPLVDEINNTLADIENTGLTPRLDRVLAILFRQLTKAIPCDSKGERTKLWKADVNAQLSTIRKAAETAGKVLLDNSSMTQDNQYIHSESSSIVTEDLDTLPIEVHCNIFDYLDFNGLSNLVQTSHYYRDVVISNTIITNRYDMHTFIANIINVLSSADCDCPSEEIQSLIEIQCLFEDQLLNIPDIKKCLINIYNQIVKVLASLDKEQIEMLKKIDPPAFYEHIISELEVSTDIENVMNTPNSPVKSFKLSMASHALEDIIKCLCEAREIEKAINVVDRLSYNIIKIHSLSFLVNSLIKIGEIEEAIKIANRLEDEKSKKDAFVSIIFALCKQGKDEKAIELTNIIIDEYVNDSYLFRIISVLCTTPLSSGALSLSASEDFILDGYEIGTIEKAIEIANRLEDEKSKNNAFVNIIFALCKNGEIEKAIAVIQSITFTFNYALAYRDVSRAFCAKGEIEIAIDVMRRFVPVSIYRDQVSIRIIFALCKNGEIEKAIEIMSNIINQAIYDQAIGSIINAFQPIILVDLNPEYTNAEMLVAIEALDGSLNAESSLRNHILAKYYSLSMEHPNDGFGCSEGNLTLNPDILREIVQISARRFIEIQKHLRVNVDDNKERRGYLSSFGETIKNIALERYYHMFVEHPNPSPRWSEENLTLDTNKLVIAIIQAQDEVLTD